MIAMRQMDPAMNTLFFRARLRDRDISQRKLASLLKLDPASISLMLRGQRRMQPAEAQQIADILGLSVVEVMREAGMPIKDGRAQVPIAGSVEASGRITLMPAGTHELTAAPVDVPLDGYALQVRDFTQIADGWLLFVDDIASAPDAHLDKLCAVSLKDGRALVAFVKRGYRAGLHNLILWPSREPLHDVAVAQAAPVLWLKPAL